MEFTKNGSLLSLVNGFGKGGMNENLTRFFFKRLIEGLECMHKHDFVHLDIKHDNILLDDSLNPKLGDFGYTQKVTGPIKFKKCTLQYAAPEVLACYHGHGSPFDAKKADIYSMGAVFYSALVFDYPKCKEPLPPGTSDALKNIIYAMLSPDPAARPSASDLLT
jgi:serine/threonine protein kinase